MGLLNGIGALKKLTRGTVSSSLNAFRDILRAKDFFNADFGVTARKWEPVGEFEVGAQQIVNVGYGSKNLPDSAGYLFVQLAKADGSLIDGKFRIVLKDANDVGKDMVFNEDLDSLRGDANDKSKMIMLEEKPTPVMKDEKIVIEVYADETATVDYDHANTKIKIPITKKYTKQM